MGACASIHKSPRVVIVRIGSKAKRIFTASPTKERPLNGKNPVGEFHFEEKHVESSGLGMISKTFPPLLLFTFSCLFLLVLLYGGFLNFFGVEKGKRFYLLDRCSSFLYVHIIF